MKTYVATKNAGKLDEMRAIFAGSPLELETFSGYEAVPEGESDYVANALLKARALHKQLQDAGIRAAVLADDSGLEVTALDGRPGVLSARYAGEDATWDVRRQTLLEELRNVPVDERGARFVSALALVLENGDEIVADGTVSGFITDAERGERGFGYDPLFLYPPAGLTFAEMSEERKNRCSHRRRAAEHLLALLRVHA